MGLRGFQGLQGQARKHARDTLGRKKSRKLPWNRKGLSRVQKVITFLEFLPITKGKLTGHKLKLLPSQRAFIEDLYGRPDDAQQVRLGILSEPRGNGKTGLIAGLELCHLLGPEAEMRGECYSAGIDRLQAGLIFNEMEAIILAEPEFSIRCNIQRYRKWIEVIEGFGVGSKYEALSADARRAHGLSPTFWAYDELAQAKDRVLLDNLQTAMGKRKRSLGVIISTQAADNDHSMSVLIDDGLTNNDPSLVVHLLSAPPEADPFDPAVIRAVNPAFGTFLDEADVMNEAERARRMPSFESAFRNLRLNQRIAPHARSQLLTPEVWAKGNEPIDREMFSDGRPVFGGLDLSSTVDLTALVLAAEDDAGNVHLLPQAWTPADTLTERSLYDRAHYDEWARDGFMTAVPGKAIDFDWVATALGDAGSRMNLRQVNYDRWAIKQFKQTMDRLGITAPIEPMGQGFQDMSPAVKAFQNLALICRIRHGNHPLLRWCFANATVVRDAADGRKLDKSKSYGRIDVAVAAIMAVGALKATTATPEYEIASMIG
jgi:phage terminase large subunit-like protein